MTHSIQGKTVRWKFDDGPTAGKSFEHTFRHDGGLTFAAINGDEKSKPSKVDHYEVAQVTPEVQAVSYLVPSGWTLTSVLDFVTNRLIAFASNDKQLVIQHGSFELVD